MSLQENYAGENALTLPKTGSSGFKSEEKGGMKDSLSSAFQISVKPHQHDEWSIMQLCK